MNTMHTPTPWTIHPKVATAVMGCSDNHVVAACGGYSTNTRDPEELNAELEANAAFIVKACNAHDDLVAALKFAKPIVGAAVAASPNETREQREKVYNKIVAALAKAGA